MQCDDMFSQHLGGRGDPGSVHRPSRARSQHRAGAGGERELPGLESVERRWSFFPWGCQLVRQHLELQGPPCRPEAGRGCLRTNLHPGRPSRARQADNPETRPSWALHLQACLLHKPCVPPERLDGTRVLMLAIKGQPPRSTYKGLTARE